MIIYILEEIVDFTGEFFVGAYSTREKALAEVERIIEARLKGQEEPFESFYYMEEDIREHHMITMYEVDKGYIAEEQVK